MLSSVHRMLKTAEDARESKLHLGVDASSSEVHDTLQRASHWDAIMMLAMPSSPHGRASRPLSILLQMP